MAHRQFGQGTKNDTVVHDPITFDMKDEKDIGCRQRVNGKLLIELVGKVESGNVGKQSEGILQVFDVCVLMDDGDDPDGWTGRKFNPDRPLEHHTAEELAALRTDYQEALEDFQLREDPKDDDEPPTPVQPGIDPTSSWGRLKKVLDDPDTDIEISELAEVVGWLVEQYTGRPTRSVATSRRGTSNTSRSSRRSQRGRGGISAVKDPLGAGTSSSDSSSSSV